MVYASDLWWFWRWIIIGFATWKFHILSFSGLGPLTPPGSSSADRGEVLRGRGFVQLCGLDESEAYRGNAKVCLFPIDPLKKWRFPKKNWGTPSHHQFLWDFPWNKPSIWSFWGTPIFRKPPSWIQIVQPWLGLVHSLPAILTNLSASKIDSSCINQGLSSLGTRLSCHSWSQTFGSLILLQHNDWHDWHRVFFTFPTCLLTLARLGIWHMQKDVGWHVF